MSDFVVEAEIRAASGGGVSRRLRRAGKIPAVVYGAGRENEHLVLDHDGFMHQYEVEAFHTSIISLKNGAGTQQVILREVQMHPYRPRILHVDFQRVRATEKIHMAVPLHFIGDDVAPGIKADGGILSRLMTEVDVTCLPKDLPEFIEVDVSALKLNDSLHLSDLEIPPNVEVTSLAHEGGDHAVAAILPPQKQVEEKEAEDEMLEEELEAPDDAAGE